MAERALGAAHALRASAGAPALFVLLWSTGFIGAKLGVPYAEPFTFLSLRFAIVLALMLPLAIVLRARWPASFRDGAHIAIAGALIQGGYLAGCFAAVARGMPAGVVALVVGLQPILTAFAAVPLLGERISRAQWLGLILGLTGVFLVLGPKLDVQELNTASVLWAVVSLLGITAGTLYQKRYCPSFDLRAGSIIQFGAALLILLPAALLTETMHVEWTGEFVFALAWLVFVLSIGAISLLFYLIEHGEATRVASLFYLTPLATAAMAYLIFGETLSAVALIGMLIGILGVALAIRRPDLATPEP
jgi:drug/metabolite transporter (DMT)-like permease